MSSLVLTGDTSGQVTLAAPAVAGTSTINLQAATATMSVNTLATAVASTSGTSIDFTGIPSWAKRITVMFNGVSTNGSSNVQIQLGSGSVTTSGYACSMFGTAGSAVSNGTQTSGFALRNGGASTVTLYAAVPICLVSGNTWATSFFSASTDGNNGGAGGSIALGGALDRVRITTVNGTDTFDAGSINIMYE